MVPPESLFGISNALLVLIVSLVSFGLAGFILWQRVFRLVLIGRKENRLDQPIKRILKMLIVVLGQQRVMQRFSLKDMAGLGHAIIFYGFVLFSISYVIFIFGDTAWHPFSETLLTETGVKFFASLLNFVAVLIIFSLSWALYRRWVARPHRLSFDLTRAKESIIIVAAIYGLMFFTLITEGFFVAAGGTGPAADTPIGGALGNLFIDMGITGETASNLQALFWWLHLIIILGFAVYIPISKHMHMVGAPVNVLFTTMQARGTLKPMPDFETAETFGAGGTEGFSWKSILDGYACAVCGRCTDNCPANISGKLLSPMHIAEGIKEHVMETGASIISAQKSQETYQEPSLFTENSMLKESAVWDCVTCGACMEECPVMVEHVDSIVDMRRYLVMEQASMPEGAEGVLLNMEQRGHPWSGNQTSKTEWMEGLDIPTFADENEAEVLLWVGCTSALNEANQKAPRAMASILRVADIKFAVLGNEEGCTGDPARRIGNEYLYQMMAEQNIQTLNQYSFKKIVTLCPHCFNNIKNEYPQLGGNYKVYHYTEFVDELIQNGKLKPVKSVDISMTYHDSCYLGRHNKVYDAPRNISKAIPGLELHEMERNCERGFCCGAGGGHMWMEDSGGQRINHMRIDQFLDTEGETLGVSCPFCYQMFAEGIQSKGVQENKQTKDLVEIIAESVVPEEEK
ncbi:MAG: 4Fe-4S dicluster domain-containing protein [Dehalococcoidia bacterium]|nr:4Fe-4S dicluster domain-containing protein [Dehalococcoidia bacterium]|tara:strand:- start:1404 stop:3461 length:2058 start_codon:yes stop_codon:yes gene_type:complete